MLGAAGRRIKVSIKEGLVFAAIALTFIAVFLLVITIFMGRAAAKDSPSSILKRRMRSMATNRGGVSLPYDVRSEILKDTPPFEKFLSTIPILKKIERNLDHAGMSLTVTSLVCYTLAGCIVAFALVLAFFHKFLFALTVVIIVILAVIAYVKFKQQQRLLMFTEQLPDALDMIARSLRSGHSMASAIELVGKEMHDPAAGLFRIAYEQQNLGLRINETLANMTHRIESLDLRFFITAVQIHSEVGGNLAEVLDNLGIIIRERLKIRRQVQVYTAQGRMSGYVLAAMPVVAFFMMKILMPNYIKLLLTTKQGLTMLVAAMIMQFIGFLFIRKIIDIRI